MVIEGGKLVQIVLKNSVRTSKRTQHLAITRINQLLLFEEIIAVYTENRTQPLNTECTVTDCGVSGTCSYH
jgi:hypothetical protein